ncbi:hypothetical protein HYC85_021661, partial [Camellia sinensis]
VLNFFKQCLDGTLSPELVKGKIVLCLSGYSYNIEKGLEVKKFQGIVFILQNHVNGIGISIDAHVLQGTTVFFNDSTTILNYIQTSKNPMATLVPQETILNSKPAPFMASFSSMGPNGLEPHILKHGVRHPFPQSYLMIIELSNITLTLKLYILLSCGCYSYTYQNHTP